MAAHDNLPLVLAALVCEQVLEEKDGVLSATRIIDRFFLDQPVPPGAERGVQFHYLVILKRGTAAITGGEHEASVMLRFPSGQREGTTIGALKVPWPAEEGEDQGLNLNMTLQLPLPAEGLYWIDLLFDGALLASTPFRVTFGPPI